MTGRWTRIAGGALLAAALALTARPPAAAATPPPAAPAVKTLDDIRIEGEIRLPRVLFLTSRETECPFDFLDHYRVAAGTPPVNELLPVLGDVPALAEHHPVSADASANVQAQRPEEIDTTEEVDR
jgi:hypothetical protein